MTISERRLQLPIDADMQPAVLALNNAHAIESSWLDPGRLQSLLAQAFYARRIGELDAFLLALDQTVAYDRPSYLWFRQRYSRFVYVDRVVVASAARGEVTPGCSTPICSAMRVRPAATSSCARSTAIRPTQRRTRSTPRWNLPMSARRALIAERKQSVISPVRSGW